MSTLGCWFAELTDRECHRVSCPRCEARSRFDAEIRRIAGSIEPRPVDSALLARAITAATGRPRPLGWPRWVGVGAGLAVAATVVGLLLSRGGGGEVSGRVELASIGPLAQGNRIAIGHAEVIATEGTLAMRTGATEIWLGHGQVEVKVDPEPHRPFRVTTTRFSVRVLGTHFVVSDAGVSVDRGAVEIVDPSGRIVVPHLVAGGRWLYAAWQTSAQTSSVPVKSNVTKINPSYGNRTAQSNNQTAVSGTQTKHHKTQIATADQKLTGVVDVNARLTELTDRIGKKLDIPAARTEIGQILARRVTREERARAESVLAESYLLTGDYAEAQRRLTDVANRYRDLPIAEAELFAASNAARSAGHAADERALLEIYLERYPNGTLHIQTRKRLDALVKTK